ncbi:ester cyclase [Chromohalobacter sp. 296-RDG]|uniref:ester cyclase n=1 Tax=Chromohalobacter sp. 296-RDG TaxID=2994062 RepID=UPI002468CDFE|nr:ester cyclase [Chromohalobacter sp. 296-RDG]
MSTEANETVVRNFYDAINRGDFGSLDRYCHPEFNFYHQIDTAHPGVEGLIASEKKNFDAFSDWQMPIREMLAYDDKVMTYMVFEGTHSGEHQGVTPTGRRVRFSLMMMLTIKDGLIVEKRAHFDPMDIRDQLTR